jgi:formylglycine-generating enzyme required for sulfatase activity
LRNRPFFWDDVERSNPIFPVVGVTWFEAEAYANWLNGKRAELHLGESFPADFVVRLPTEAEWERAARGTDGREYPWGDLFDPTFCNTEESDPERKYGIGATAVCTYPQGASPIGAWDMSGNVWEWTCSPWSADDKSPVVRGGSWLSHLRYARCACRSGYAPDDFYSSLGFRVVVSLSNPGF